MRKYLFICALVVVLTGCRPKGVLSSREMRDLLYDLHRSEAILQCAGYNYGHDEAVSKYYYEVLARHGVTQAQFDSSLVWYTDHPELFNKIYPKVVERMNAEIALADEENNRIKESALQAQKIQRELSSIPPINIDSIVDICQHGWPVWWYQEPEKWEVNVPFAGK